MFICCISLSIFFRVSEFRPDKKINLVSIRQGIAFYSDRGEDTNTLIHNVESVMSDAVNQGQNRFIINCDPIL